MDENMMEPEKPEGEEMMDDKAPLMEDNMEENKEEEEDGLENIFKMAKCIIWAVWAVIATFNIILLVAVTVYSGDHQGCGIPIYEWFTIEYTVSLLKYTLILPVVCMFGRCTGGIFPYAAVVFLTISWGQLFWMGYGWSIYFSDKNDCYDHGEADTAGWLIWMIIVLWQGLFFMILVVVLTCCCICGMAMLKSAVSNAPGQDAKIMSWIFFGGDKPDLSKKKEESMAEEEKPMEEAEEKKDDGEEMENPEKME